MPVPRRILVTGSGGFVGAHLMPALAHAYPEAAIMGATADVTHRDAVMTEIF